MNFSPKYLIKLSLFPAFLLLSILIIGSLSANYFLAKSKNKIERITAERIKKNVSIGSISYQFPHSIILRNIYIFTNKPTGTTHLISIKKIKLGISLISLLTNKYTIITHVRVDRLNASYLQCMLFLRQNFEDVKAFIESLPEGRPVKISSKDASFSLTHKDGGISYVIIDSVSEIKNRDLFSSGSIGVKYDSADKNNETKQNFDMQPLRYNIIGHLLKSGIDIENIQLNNDNFCMKLWGFFEKGAFRLHGFASLSDFFKKRAAQKSGSAIAKRLRDIFSKKYDSAQAVLDSKSNLNIAYINCLMKITPLSLRMQNLSFSINNIPLQLEGNIGFIPPISIDLTLSSYPSQLKKLRRTNPQRFDLKAAGNIKEEGFNGRIWIEFLKRNERTALSQNIDTILSNASLHFIGSRHLKLRLDEADIKYTSGNNTYKAVIHNLNSLLYIKSNKIKFLQLNSLIYGGSLNGNGFIDFSDTPFKCAFDMNLKNISSNELSSLLVHLSKVKGKADTRIHYRNFPQASLNGKITICDGELSNFEFFKWLADFFNLPSLYKINFDTLAMSFFVNDSEAKIDNINLNSKEITLSGYFRQDKNDLVASKISLGLPKELLESSPKFTPLVRLLGKDFKIFRFDFQLSGLLHAMNFKWLKSDFKLKLQNSIPNFIERRIERKIEAAIKPISEKP